MNESDDLIACIYSADAAILDDNETWNMHMNSYKMDWIQVLREFDFINDKNKFFNYVNAKHQEECE